MDDLKPQLDLLIWQALGELRLEVEDHTRVRAADADQILNDLRQGA